MEVIDGTSTVLQLRGVVKSFGRGAAAFTALDHVDLDLVAGEFVALLGPSGSGKSTLIHLSAGLDEPDAGSVIVLGHDLASASKQDRARMRRRDVGLVFQFFHLLPALTVRENIALPLLLDGRRREDAVDDLLARVGLADRADHFPAELSGGQMQRTAIARALVTEPRLVLADEPTGNLDSATGEAVMELLCSTVRDAGAGLLLVTHDERIAARADRRVRLCDGRLKTAGGQDRHAPVAVAPAGPVRRRAVPLRTRSGPPVLTVEP